MDIFYMIMHMFMNIYVCLYIFIHEKFFTTTNGFLQFAKLKIKKIFALPL